MKRIFFIVCLVCFSSFFSSKASAHHHGAPIDFIGGLLGGPMRNLPQVEGYLNAASVDLVFNFDFGELIIEVVNQTGETIFKTKIDAVTGGTLPIDTSGWESGEYILMIMDEQGGYLEGCFRID